MGLLNVKKKNGSAFFFICCIAMVLSGAFMGSLFSYESPQEIECEASYSFGNVSLGKSLEHEFKIKNNGNRDVRIKKIKRNCSCIVPELKSKLIKPKNEISIKVAMKTEGRIGKIAGACVVLFEEKTLDPIKLSVDAIIYSETAMLSKNKVVFRNIVSGEKAYSTVSILKFHELSDLTIEKITSSSDFIKVRYNSNKGNFVCMLDEKYPLGKINEQLFIDCVRNGYRHKIQMPVIGEVIGPYVVDKKELFLGRQKCGGHYQEILTIKDLKGDISSGMIAPTHLQSLQFIENGSDFEKYQVTIMVPQTPGFFEGVLSFHTSCQEQEYIEVTYSGMAIK